MQTIPFITISEGIPATYLPLFVVLLVSALKDFYEDYKRKKSDYEENHKSVYVYENKEFIKKTWKQIKVGNIIKVFLF